MSARAAMRHGVRTAGIFQLAVTLCLTVVSCDGPVVRVPLRTTDAAPEDEPDDDDDLPSGRECSKDADCSGEDRLCSPQFQRCVECYRDEHCRSNETCDIDDGECEARRSTNR